MGFDFGMSAEDIKVFLDEADEQLQVMEAGILKLEKESDSAENLQEIFRAAHTLKGSSATLGHKKMAEVTHSMENVLDKLRKGKLVVSRAVVDTLFACLDVLQAFKEEIASGEESGITTDEILNRLSAIDGVAPAAAQTGATAGGTPAAAGGAPGAAASAAATVATMPKLAAEDENRLADGLQRGMLPVWVRISFDPNAQMPAVRAFQLLLALGDLGEVVRSWPSQQDVEEDKVSDELKVLLLTARDLAQVRSTVESVPDIKPAEIAFVQVPSGEQVAEVAAAAAVPVQPSAAIETPEGEAAQAQGTGTAGKQDQSAAMARKNAARTVRVDVEVLDNLMSLVGELVIDRTRLLQVQTRLESERDGDDLVQIMSSALTHIGRMTSDLQDEIQRARMLPVDNLFRKFPRMVRDIANKAGKEIDFVVLGEETELDRSVIEEIGDPLMHLLRNSVDHGVESPAERLRAGKPSKGTVTLEAFHEENHIIISVRDDGRGIDPNRVRQSAVRKGILSEEAAKRMPDQEVINLVWSPGFSTAEKISDISGRGVGLDVVHKNIEKLNGSVEIKTEIGKGTEFRIKLPLTLAIIRSLQVQVLDTTYCIPLGSVVETDQIPVTEIKTVRQREVIVKRGEVIPLVRLIDAFQLQRPADSPEPEELFVVIVAVMGKQIGIVVDGLIGEGDVVIKPLGKFIGDIPGISGATIMGDGDVAIILDISSLINSVRADLNRVETLR